MSGKRKKFAYSWIVDKMDDYRARHGLGNDDVELARKIGVGKVALHRVKTGKAGWDLLCRVARALELAEPVIVPGDSVAAAAWRTEEEAERKKKQRATKSDRPAHHPRSI